MNFVLLLKDSHCKSPHTTNEKWCPILTYVLILYNYPNKTMGCTQYEFSTTTDNRSSRLVDIAYNLCKFLYNKCNHNYQSVYLVIYRF